MSLNRTWRVFCSFVLTASLVLSAAPASAARTNPGQSLPGKSQVMEIHAVQFDQSPALRNLAQKAQAARVETAKITLPLGKLLKSGGSASAAAFLSDSALQSAAVPSLMPSPAIHFEGINNTYGVAPPDTNGDIGPRHYVQWVNLGFQVWEIDRAQGTATSILGPVNGSSLWSGFGGPCEINNDGDPIVLYDALADRWFMSQFAVSGVNYQCIAVSKTGDPTGAWYRYAYDWGIKMNDYPKFGVWPDAYYMSVNQFTVPGYGWAGAGVAAFDREKMLLGLPASAIMVDLYNVDKNFGGMLPADLDGSPPPAGTPGYFMEVDDSSAQMGPTDELRVWEFSVNWQNPSESTFGQGGKPNFVSAVEDFQPLCWGSGVGACIPQKGTTRKLDQISDRLMYRLAYRYFPGAQPYESMVVNHTVNVGTDLTPRAGVRWYEVHKSSGQYSITQQSTFGGNNPNTDITHRWMGSIAMDWQGNLALGYSMSSDTIYPSIGYTGRLASDPPNSMAQGEVTMFQGSASQEGVDRWGDYSSMSVDPLDECTFWFTTQYSTGGWNWATRIGAFKMPSCTAQPRGAINGKVMDEASSPIQGAIVKSGPYMATSDADGNYSFPLLLPGTYDLQVIADGFSSSSAAGLAVTTGQTTSQDFNLTHLNKAQVSFSVVDGSKHLGMPLYAAIRVKTPYANEKLYFTDPLTGQVSIDLYQGQDYSLTAGADYYRSATRTAKYASATASEIFSLLNDLNEGCGPGYQEAVLSTEEFENDTKSLPTGWSVFQQGDPNAPTFEISSSYAYSGLYSARHGYAQLNIDSLLVTPAITIPENGALAFQEFGVYAEYYYDHALLLTTGSDPDPLVSTYVRVKQFKALPEKQWQKTYVDLSDYAGQTVHLAFEYSGFDADEWYIDDAQIITCQPVQGGQLLGFVTDSQTGLPINDAVVTGPAGSTTSRATPDDTNLPDGFYSTFLPAGQSTISATRAKYNTVQATVNMTADSVARQDFALLAGKLVPDSTTVSVSLDPLGQPVTQTIHLSNPGGIGLTYTAREFNSSTPPNWNSPTGSFAQPHRHVSPKKLNVRSLQGVTSYQAPVPGPMSQNRTATSWNSGLTYLWGMGYNSDAKDLWLGETEGINIGYNLRYTLAGAKTTDKVKVVSDPYAWVADMAYNPITAMFWQVNVAGDNCIFEFDPKTKAVTGNKICPPVPISQRGLAYDPFTNTFYSGSWSDGVIYHFDSTGKILDSMDVGLSIAGLAYNPATGHLFVANNPVNTTAIFVLDVHDQYSTVDSFNIQGVSSYKESLDIDCQGQLWLVSQPLVFKTQPIERGVCTWKDIPWLTVSPQSGSISSQGSQDLVLTIDPKGAIPGNYTGYVVIYDNTPYQPTLIQVNFTVLGTRYQTYLPSMSR